MTHPQLFCDNHNDKSRNLMLLPALQLSIPIILLFVNIPLEFPWWWRLGCVMCGLWWTRRVRKIENIDHLRCMLASHQYRASLPVHVITGSSLSHSRPIRGRYQGNWPIRGQMMTTYCARDSLINAESDGCRIILCHHMFRLRVETSRPGSQGNNNRRD